MRVNSRVYKPIHRPIYVSGPTALRNFFALPLRFPLFRSMPHEHIQTLLNANEEWSQSVIKDTPSFFTQLATGQSPKVCPPHAPLNPIHDRHLRSFGLAAPTHEYRNQSSQLLSRVTSLCTETSPSTYKQQFRSHAAASSQPSLQPIPP